MGKLSKKLISISDIILIHYSLSFSRIQRIAGLPNLFIGLVRATIAGEKLLRATCIFTKSFYQEIQTFF